MSAANSTDQTFITDDGQIGSQPLTWDGQPLYSPETVKEGLFDASAFEQQPGQLAMEETESVTLDNEWRAARASAAPLERGSAVVFTYDGQTMSGEVDDISSCGITVYGRESSRRYLVGSQDVRRETAHEQDRRERLGYYAEDAS